MSIVLANATLVDLRPRRVRRGHVVVDRGRIIGVHNEVPSDHADVVDLAGRILVPGNVCAHTHLYSALACGMPAPAKAPRNFLEILQYVWWRLDRALDETSIRASVLVGCLDALRAGTTTLVDHHASPECIDGSLDIIADAVDRVGMRGILCYEVTDRNGSAGKQAGLRENERFLMAPRRDRVRGMVGAHASFTLDDDSLQELAALADRSRTGVHIHVGEDLADEEDSVRRCGKRAAHRLADAGILRAGSIAAHGVHLDADEMDIVRGSKSWLVHNCRSNMNNSVGRAPVAQFGTRCALGTDGIDGDMFAESRTAFFRGREESLDTSAEQYLDLLANGSELVSDAFGAPVGRIAEGAAADLTVLRHDAWTPLNADNLAWHWAFNFTAREVESVMIDGRWVLKDGEVPGLDEEKIRAEARVQARALWSRMEVI